MFQPSHGLCSTKTRVLDVLALASCLIHISFAQQPHHHPQQQPLAAAAAFSGSGGGIDYGALAPEEEEDPALNYLRLTASGGSGSGSVEPDYGYPSGEDEGKSRPF